MALEIIIVFEGLQGPLKSDVSANMAATCPQLGPQHAPKLGPKWCRNRSRRPMGPHGAPLHQVWIDYGLIFDRFWVDFWLFFCRLLGAYVGHYLGYFWLFLWNLNLNIFETILVGIPLPSNQCCCKFGGRRQGAKPFK